MSTQVQSPGVRAMEPEPVEQIDPADPDEHVDAALVGLYHAHYRSLVRTAVLLLRDVEAAEDVVQDAFVDLYRRLHRLEDPGRAAAYLRRAVVNRSRSVLRHRRVVDRAPRDLPGTAPGADTGVLAGVRRTAVLNALAALPRRQREVLVLRHYLELSEQEIAAALGIGRGSVKTHASRGSAALRTTLHSMRDIPPEDR